MNDATFKKKGTRHLPIQPRAITELTQLVEILKHRGLRLVMDIVDHPDDDRLPLLVVRNHICLDTMKLIVSISDRHNLPVQFSKLTRDALNILANMDGECHVVTSRRIGAYEYLYSAIRAPASQLNFGEF